MGQSGTAVACSARRWSKPQSSSPAPSIRSRPYPPRRRCVASRSSFRSRSKTPLMHVKGYAAPETKAAVEQARLLIEQAEALGEPLEDPLLLFSVLYGFWVANYVAFNGDAMRELASAVPSACREARATIPLMIGHRLMGISLVPRETSPKAERIYDQRDRALQSCRASSAGDAIWRKTFGWQSYLIGRWLCGCLAIPRPHLRTLSALKDAREIGQAATLMYALLYTIVDSYLLRKLRSSKSASSKNLSRWRTKKEPCFGRRTAQSMQGCLLALTGKASDAVHMITSGMTAYRLNGSNMWLPLYLSSLGESLCGAWPIR